MFSHGAHDLRADTTTVVQQLASHGYAVVTVDHTDDAYTEFPGGPVLAPVLPTPVPMSPRDFAADARFVLDASRSWPPAATRTWTARPCPTACCGAWTCGRIGMFGWSKGGTATA